MLHLFLAEMRCHSFQGKKAGFVYISFGMYLFGKRIGENRFSLSLFRWRKSTPYFGWVKLRNELKIDLNLLVLNALGILILRQLADHSK